MQKTFRAHRGGFPRVFVYVLLCILCYVPLSQAIFGPGIIPSLVYLPFGYSLFAVLFTLTVYALFPHVQRGWAGRKDGDSVLEFPPPLIIFPLLALMLFIFSVSAVPYAITRLLGHPTTEVIEFSSAQYDLGYFDQNRLFGSGYKRDATLSAAGRPFWARTLHHVPQSVFGNFSAGERLKVIGIGSWAGIIPHSVSR